MPILRILLLIRAAGLGIAVVLAPVPAAAGMLEPNAAAAVPADLAEQPVWVTLVRGPDGISLQGRVPDTLTATVLTTYAAALFGADRVVAELSEAAAEGVSPGWANAVMAAADTLSAISEGAAEVTESAVRVTGRVDDPEEAGALTRVLRGKLGPGVRVATEFSVAVPDVVSTLTFSPERCAYLMTRIAAEEGIRFATGATEVDEESAAALGTIAGLFERCPGAEIEVSGYTDSRGDEQMNLDLSQARAEAVMAMLLRRGVPLRRLRARGFGAADPVASNETEAGRARNRRIEFRAVE